jgi:hypothetical protein
MERYFQYVVFEEDDAYVARCLDVEVASEGDTQIPEGLMLFFQLALQSQLQRVP